MKFKVWIGVCGWVYHQIASKNAHIILFHLLNLRWTSSAFCMTRIALFCIYRQSPVLRSRVTFSAPPGHLRMRRPTQPRKRWQTGPLSKWPCLPSLPSLLFLPSLTSKVWPKLAGSKWRQLQVNKCAWKQLLWLFYSDKLGVQLVYYFTNLTFGGNQKLLKALVEFSKAFLGFLKVGHVGLLESAWTTIAHSCDLQFREHTGQE